MASVDLLFSKTQLTQPAALVFGEGESLTDYEVALAVTFPLSFAAAVVKVYEANVAVTFPLAFAAEAAYSSNTARPLVGQVVSPFQNGTFTEVGVQDSAQPVAQVLAGVNDAFNQGLPIETGATLRFQGAVRLGNYGQTQASMFGSLANVLGNGAIGAGGARDAWGAYGAERGASGQASAAASDAASRTEAARIAGNAQVNAAIAMANAKNRGY